MALQWSDIDFEKQKLFISKAVVYAGAKHGIIDKDAKTASSRRAVYVPDFLINLIRTFREEDRELKEQLLMTRLCEDYIFVNYRTGTRVFPDTPAQWFERFLLSNGLYKIIYHELRHSYTSLLYEDNIDLAKISKSLGHSSIATTTRVYVHPIEDFKPVLAASFDNKFGSNFIVKESEKKE